VKVGRESGYIPSAAGSVAVRSQRDCDKQPTGQFRYRRSAAGG